MDIRRLRIKNYKSFLVETTLEFEPGFNVLIGANSSGKTSVCEAIEISQFANRPHRSILNITEPETIWPENSQAELCVDISLDEIARDLVPHRLLSVSLGNEHGGAYATNTQEIDARLASTPLELEFSHRHTVGVFGHLQFRGWPTPYRPFNGNSNFVAATVHLDTGKTQSVGGVSETSGDLQALWGGLARRTYRFSAERIVQEVSGHHANGQLLPTGANLAYCLNWLQSENSDLFSKLNGLVQRIFPTIYWIGARPNPGNQFELRVHTVPTASHRGDLAVPISQVGTGVFNALAMLYVALTAKSQQIILFEEPNSFLHPRALRELLAILADIGKRHQYFITTHSSDVLRTINAATVTLFQYDGQQSTVKQAAGSGLHEFRAGLIDLGIRLTDLHGCDRVLWVEGESEEAIFPLVLRHFFPSYAEGIAVLPLHATGDFEAKRINPAKVTEIYRRLSQENFLAPPIVAIALDREKKQQSQIDQIQKDCDGVVHFLPKVMLEDYLLYPAAIADVLQECFAVQIGADRVEEILSSANAIPNNRLFPQHPSNMALHAAKTLEYVFVELGGPGASFHKTEHGPKLAAWILKNDASHFRELELWFRDMLIRTEER